MTPFSTPQHETSDLFVPQRRGLIKGAGMLSAGALLMLAGAPTRAQGMGANSESDARILNVALALEHEAINAYQLGAESGLLQKPVLALAVRFQSDHKAHRDALVATIGNGHDFRNGRQLAAWLGLTPSQHSSGGKARLGTISCRGDGYLRTLLIQGARSSLQRAQVVAAARATPEQIWIRDLASRLPFGKVVVAIANKHARQAWAMLARGEDYDAHAWLKHPMVQRPASKRRQQACS